MAKGKYEKWLTPDGLILLQGWARDGLTDEQIAHNMGISRETLNVWKNKFSIISDTLKMSKAIVDYEVENALYKNATGYKYTEEVVTKAGVIEVERYAKPDTTAQIFWLKNRKKAEWRDKPEEIKEQEGGITIVNNIPRPDKSD